MCKPRVVVKRKQEDKGRAYDAYMKRDELVRARLRRSMNSFKNENKNIGVE